MTYEELNAAHVAELLALGVPPEELEAVLAAWVKRGSRLAWI